MEAVVIPGTSAAGMTKAVWCSSPSFVQESTTTSNRASMKNVSRRRRNCTMPRALTQLVNVNQKLVGRRLRKTRIEVSRKEVPTAMWPGKLQEFRYGDGPETRVK